MIVLFQLPSLPPEARHRQRYHHRLLGSLLAQSLPRLSRRSHQPSLPRLLAKLDDLHNLVLIWQVMASPFALVDHWQALAANFTVIRSLAKPVSTLRSSRL
jgi:hypothetical protein